MDELSGLVAVITGGASGIGKATVQLFVERGARVLIADMQDEAGEALAAACGGAAVYCRTDVRQEDDVQAALAEAVERFGRLDVLFNNAGIPGPMGPIEAISAADFDRAQSILLRGVFLGMKHAAPIMKRQRSGSIISTASIAGMQAGFAGHAYGAAKAAVIHLTTSVAMELGECGVRVNCICPGFVVTPIIYRAAGVFEETEQSAERLAELMSTQQPLRRVCRPDEIAQAALWLASDSSSYVTGHALVVDGGLIGGRLWSAQQKARKLLNSALDLAAA